MESNIEIKATPVMDIEQRYQKELKEMVERLMQAGRDKRANDVIGVHVGDKTIVAEWFVFMSGRHLVMSLRIRPQRSALCCGAARAITRDAGLCLTFRACLYTSSIPRRGNTTTLKGFGWIPQLKLSGLGNRNV